MLRPSRDSCTEQDVRASRGPSIREESTVARAEKLGSVESWIVLALQRDNTLAPA